MSIEGESGLNHAAHLVASARQRPVQDVVDVGRDDEALDRQPHPLCGVARKNVAEIAGGHGEGDRPVRRAERDRGGEVVDDLRDDAAPVDGVDAGEARALAEGLVVEHGFDQRLAVVERALDGDRLDVLLTGGGHLPPLHRRDAAVGKEDRDVDPLAAAERFDRRSAGIAGGGADDGEALAALRQEVLHQPGEELHRQVLEGEGRAVEELQQEMIGADLVERRHGVVAEGGVGRLGHLAQRRILDLAAGEAADDAEGRLGVGARRQARRSPARRAAAIARARRGRRRRRGRRAPRREIRAAGLRRGSIHTAPFRNSRLAESGAP